MVMLPSVSSTWNAASAFSSLLNEELRLTVKPSGYSRMLRFSLPRSAPHPRQPAIARRARFRHDRGGRHRHGGEHRPPPVASWRRPERDRLSENQAGRPRGAAAGLLLHHYY